jgi:hypothetical protein
MLWYFQIQLGERYRGKHHATMALGAISRKLAILALQAE